MAILSNPTFHDINARTVLRPEQVNARYGITHDVQDPTEHQAWQAYKSDVEDRIELQSEVVELRLLSRWRKSQIQNFTDPIKAAVKLAKELMTAGDLYESAGQLHEAYNTEAQRYFDRANQIINDIVNMPVTGNGDNNDDGGGGADSMSGMQVLTIGIGNNFGDEVAW